MGLLIFLQVIFDLAFIATATLLLIERSKGRTTEDPRLSRGLQLLSSKIAIIQDLMDRSEVMTRQMTKLIDGKQQDIQERLEDAEVHLHKIRQATEKSEKVARIFQTQIPHQELIERQNAAKYSQAAKLSNQGLTIEEISRQVDLPRGELDLIVKVNRNRIITEKIDTSVQTQNDFDQQTPKSFDSQVFSRPEAVNNEEEPVQVQPVEQVSQVVNAGNKPAQIRPFVFRKIISGKTYNLDELDLQK